GCCLEMGRVVPQRSLPLVGEGQGEGWRQTPSARLVSSPDSQTMAACIYRSQHETDAVRVLPLSLSLPHKGGGNRGARTLATHANVSADGVPEKCAYASACAGTKGITDLAKRNQKRCEISVLGVSLARQRTRGLPFTHDTGFM